MRALRNVLVNYTESYAMDMRQYYWSQDRVTLDNNG